jgi:uncharacterized protein (TIGR02145 family)
MKHIFTRFSIGCLVRAFIPVFALILTGTPSSLKGQLVSTCENSDFNLGTFKGWNGCYGHYATPCERPGFLTGPPYPPGFSRTLHKIIPAPGWLDYNTCNTLTNVFPGESYVTRLGDTSYTTGGTGKEAEMSYQVVVSNDSYLFIYRYAVVLQTGGHYPPDHQPDFQVMITDAGGNVLDSTCGYFYITAQLSGPPVNGWNFCAWPTNGGAYWKDWTTVGMDLTAYFGQTIYITFKVRPCSYDTHFGYAYISAYCGYLQVQTALCQGDTSATLTAPPGFTYLWSTGDTTQQIIVPNPVTGQTYTCTLTAVNGCQVTITVNLTYTVIHSNFTHGSACAGSPTQFNDSSYVNQNWVTDWKWDFGDGSPLVLHDPAPQHTFTNPGNYNVKLVSSSTEGCKDSIVKQIHVDTVAHVTNTPLHDTLCSNQSTNVTLTGSLPGTTFTWTATCKYVPITGYSSNNVPTTILNQTLVNTGTLADTVFYKIYPHTGDCIGPDSTYWVVVMPLPLLTNSPLVKSICDSTNTAITLSSNHDSTKFTWTCTASSLNLTGYSDNTTTPTTLINQVIDNTGFTVDTVYYHITPHLMGCPGNVTIFKVAVYPTPNLSNSPKTKTICDNTGTNITLTSNVAGTQFTWTCTPSSGNVIGWANTAVPTTVLNQTLDNTGNNIETVTYHITPHVAGCNGHVTDFVVTVYPTPVVTNNPLVQNQCSGLNTLLKLNANIAGTLFTWTCTPSAPTITGWANNAVPDDSITQVLVNSSFVLQTVTYHITPVYNGCTGPAVDFIARVYPVPNLSNSPLSKSQCSNTATNITLTSNVATTQFTWTCTPSSGSVTGWANNAVPGTLLNQTLINSGFNIETVTYHITPIASGCNGPVTDYVVTVYPVPNLSNSPLTKTQCDNLPIGVTLTSDVAGTQFTWTCTPSSGNITGWANNAVPTTSLNQTLDNTGFNTETVTYHITPAMNGCNGIATDYVVTVYPTPNVSNSPLNKGICQGQSTNINLTSNVTGTLFTWTCTQISGNVGGWSANPGPPAGVINQTLSLTGFVKDSVIYNITPIANGCTGPVYNYKVYVNPVPAIITNPLFDSICSAATTNIHLLSTCAGTTFNWTAALGTGNVTGFANGSGDWIIQTLTNNITTVGSVVYTITPSTSTCIGAPALYTMNVKPTPHVTNAPLNGAICNNMAFILNLTSDVLGTSFTWTCTPSSGNITGWSNSGSPSTTINQTLVNTGIGPETVTYHITPTALGCNGPTVNYVVTVYLTALVTNAPPSKNQCDNVATNVTLTSNVPGALFTWTCTPSSGNVTGWANNAVPTTLLNQTLDNTGFNIETVTYHITPQANGCSGTTSDYIVTMFPTPDLTNSPLSKTQCDNLNTNIPLTSNVAGTLYTWTCTPSSGSITGWANNAVPIGAINQVLDNTGNNIETVTYHITPTANGCNGSVYDYTVTIYPTPTLTNAPASQSQCNSQNTNITLTSNVAGTQFTWTCTPSSGNITGWSNSGAPGTTINQLLTNTGLSVETVTYHVTPQANGCSGPVQDYVVSVVLTTDLSNSPPAKSQCNNQNTNITLTSSVMGTTFTWTCTPSSGNITGWANNALPTTLLAQTLVNSGFNIETVTYHIIPSVSGCPGTPADYIVTVFPTPNISNSPLSKFQCDNLATNITLTSNVIGTQFTWTCTPSSGNITGWANNAVPTTSLNQTLDNTGFNIETVTYHITPAANGCNGNVADYVVTIYPTPNLSNTPASKSQCDNLPTGITLTSNVVGTLFTWTCTASSGNITGWANNAVPTTTLNQTLDNTGFNIETVTYHLTPAANGCNGPVTDYTVTVYPTPNLSNSPASKSQCDNLATNITLTSNVAGTQFTWTCTPSSGNITGWGNNAVPTTTLNQTLDNTGFNTETVVYHLTPIANGCNGTVTNYTVTVFPTPNLSNSPASKAQCDNLPTNIILTSNVAGTQFTWTCTPSSANINGWANNAVPTTSLNQTLDNTGSAIETVTYHLTPQANGCNGPVTDYIVTIYPTATVTNSPLSKNQCDNQNTNITLTSNVAGTLYIWTCTPSSGNITGWANNAAPSLAINQVLDNTGFNIETVVYHITPSANGCTGIPADYTVTVFPTPNLSNSPASKAQCDNLATNITLTSNVAGTLFTWTCTPSSANITGWTNNAVPTTALNQTLNNTGFNVETVTYNITPIANGCPGNITPYIVTVYPTPNVSNAPLSMQLCNNSATNLTLTSNVTGTLFTWTCTPSSGNITGWSNNAVPTVILNQTLVNLGLNIENVVYHLTPSANGCNGPVTDYTVTVVQSPDVFFNPPAQTICSNQTSNINILSSVPGTTYTWTVLPSSPNLSGQAPGSGNSIAQTVTNSGNTIETVTYTVTPTAWGCPPGISQNVILTVNPRPVVNNAVTNFQICSASATNIIPTSTVPGSTYTWTASGSSGNVTGFSNGAGMSIVQTLTNTGFNIEAVTYQIIATANGCPGNATPFMVTVFPVANVIFTPNGQSFCSGGTTSLGISSSVAGTSYTWTATGSAASISGYAPGSGNFIQQTLFNSGPYPETVTYLVSPTANGCPGTNNSVVATVNPFPVMSFNPPCFDPVITINSQPIPLKGALPLGGTYSGPGVSAGIFYPAIAGPGTHILSYSYTNTWGCAGNTTASISVVTLAPFICGNNLIDVRDNKSYTTVQIGTQCWFSVNLDYGNNIPSAQMQQDNCIPEKYCYGDNPVNCITVGGMYQWDELMQYRSNSSAQGLCPPEWHIPTEAEWTTLFNFYISNGFAGSPLKNTGYSGFNALLSGTRFNNVEWDFLNFAIMLWSSTSHGPKKAWAHGMNTYNPSVSYYPSHRNNAFWTRCIKD